MLKRNYWLNGLLIGCIIIAVVILESTKGKGVDVFFHLSGLILVFGGTIATTFIAWPPGLVGSNFKVILLVLKKTIPTAREVVIEVVKLANDTQGDLRALEAAMSKIEHPFLKDGVQFLIDRVEEHYLEELLKQRIKQHRADYESVVSLIRGLGKYPPAFGMIGTLVGLVALMRGLGTSVGAGGLGSAMAIGLVATFYGVAFANLVIMPMTDNIAFKSNQEIINRTIIVKGLMLIKQGANSLLIQDALNAMLKISDRVDVLGINVASSNSNKKAA